jgi:hypothetical protein
MARRVLRFAFQHAICVERPRAVSFRVEDFQPGDFTVTPVLDGFLIGKTLRRTPIDSWWTLVRVVADETDAVREAVTLALAENSRVWFQEGPGRFRSVPMKTSKPPEAAPNEPGA